VEETEVAVKTRGSGELVSLTLHTNDAKNARYTKRIHEANLRYSNERTIWRAQANERTIHE
jgi:hypothetical protein